MKPRIKFCGMTQKEDVLTAIKLEADFTGFIFYKQSPRFISPTQVIRLCQGIDFKATRKVGVFVNASLNEVISTCKKVGLDAIQIHGNEDVTQIKKIEQKTGVMLWKTVRIKDKKSIQIIRQNPLEYFLIDTYSHNSYGGTGKRIDLKLVKECCQLQKNSENAVKKNIIIAGGINPDNIRTILPYAPWGIDVNSGVELSPGVKDHQKMSTMIQALGVDKISDN